MTELYDKIMSQKGGLEKLVMKIPGFRGYHEKQARREADRMLRDHIAAQIEKCNDRMLDIEKKILKLDGGLMLMSTTREAKDQIRIYADRVQAAAPGYSGMWAAVKIGETELDKLYAFDEAQIRYVDQLNAAIDKLEKAVKSKEGIEDAIDEIQSIASEGDDAFQLRENVLTDLDKSL